MRKFLALAFFGVLGCTSPFEPLANQVEIQPLEWYDELYYGAAECVGSWSPRFNEIRWFKSSEEFLAWGDGGVNGLAYIKQNVIVLSDLAYDRRPRTVEHEIIHLLVSREDHQGWWWDKCNTAVNPVDSTIHICVGC
jgi:hypothetical protein